ncbi:MAG: FtsW/RodA/SpoVE family cell cycle protein [Oscillospiraceae bacterium]
MNQIGQYFSKLYRRTDRLLLVLCLTCSVLSIALLWGIYLCDYIKLRVVVMQMVAVFMGFGAAMIISLIDYRSLANLWKFYMPLTAVLVMLTYFFGIQRYSYVDDKAWLQIPLIGLQFQPSELLKIAFVLAFALHLEKVKESINDPRTLLLLCIHGAIPTGMVMLQGDHGTAMVFVSVFVCMLFVAGLNLRYVAVALAATVAVSPLIWFFILDDNKRERILAVWGAANDPLNAGYQQEKGIVAIGSGQLWGKGIFSGDHQFTPEMHNDFIFSFAGEALGFMGCCAIIALLALLCLNFLLNARRATDPLGRLICVGVFGMIAFQVVWSIGMCLSLLPVAGLTLPLLSAGGTSVVTTWLAVGLVMSVHRFSYVGLFDGR